MPPYIAAERTPLVGFWGEPTSTLDWCEENYIQSPYIAEFWNTVTNMSMILPALVGLWNWHKFHLETRYLMVYLALLLVGVGSLLFHGTLLYSMQFLTALVATMATLIWTPIHTLLLDELPMLFGVSLVLYTLYEMGQIQGTRTVRTYLTAAILLLYPTIVSLVYIFINDPTFHEAAYGLMVIAIIIQSFYCIKRYNSWKYLNFGLTSVAIYAFGFLLWNMDNHFCPSLREYRKSMSSPLGVLTQLHGWWHLLAGFGTYLQVVLSCRVRLEYLKYPCSLKFLFGIPYLEVATRKT